MPQNTYMYFLWSYKEIQLAGQDLSRILWSELRALHTATVADVDRLTIAHCNVRAYIGGSISDEIVLIDNTNLCSLI